jgi:hypothetical protein
MRNSMLPREKLYKWAKKSDQVKTEDFSFPEDEDGDGSRNVGFIHF